MYRSLKDVKRDEPCLGFFFSPQYQVSFVTVMYTVEKNPQTTLYIHSTKNDFFPWNGKLDMLENSTPYEIISGIFFLLSFLAFLAP